MISAEFYLLHMPLMRKFTVFTALQYGYRDIQSQTTGMFSNKQGDNDVLLLSTIYVQCYRRHVAGIHCAM